MSVGLFERFGIELEYMIVQRGSLDVLPVCDRVLYAASGNYDGDAPFGDLICSNELVLHVIEPKTDEPAERLEGLAGRFQDTVQRVNTALADCGGRLMPTAMHPWMDPARETRLWPHAYNRVYEAFNRIFDCRGHGWANLQSAHINLPFANDREFAQLHAAIRMVLPILPALAASSPIVEGRLTGLADTRLEVYRLNSRRVPEVAGRVIPEPACSRQEYHDRILHPMYRAIAPLDPEGTLQHEWLNARGAIARFDRDTIEIRVLDVQECPRADVAIAQLIVGCLRALIAERWRPMAELQAWPVEPLEDILLDAIRRAERAEITDERYLRVFGLGGAPSTAGALWQHIHQELFTPAQRRDPELQPLDTILNRGTLSTRITAAAGPQPAGDRIRAIYRALCDCLAEGRMFDPPPCPSAGSI